ncbi:Pathogenesis-related transcriptional activator PTI6 [Forsythia ovata]|uniref:Pathogenesis-related transcriptional activator PTI6 n=1 Tax=Forsythia ovata TaxID=205694 RepID=A0ABD1PEX8_9LAMI
MNKDLWDQTRNKIDTLWERKRRAVAVRPWGRWATEIHDPTSRKRVWLGTYDTPEKAASVYDSTAVKLRSPSGVTNFSVAERVSIALTESITESLTEIDAVSSGKESTLSPTSVLRRGEFTQFDDLYGGPFLGQNHNNSISFLSPRLLLHAP